MKRTIMLVEGFLDAEVLGRILKVKGFTLERHKSRLDPFWLTLVPTRFPVADDLLERVNVPMFYMKSDSQVAIKACGSLSKIEVNYKVLRDVHYQNFNGIDNVFIFADADKNPEPKVRTSLVSSLGFPNPGKAVAKYGSTHYGLYIVPDNSSQGTIENVLLNAGSFAYSDLLAQATTFVASVDKTKLNSDDLLESSKPFGTQKAVLSVATSILKPGKSTAPSVSDNRWVDTASLVSPDVQAIAQYISPYL